MMFAVAHRATQTCGRRDACYIRRPGQQPRTRRRQCSLYDCLSRLLPLPPYLRFSRLFSVQRRAPGQLAASLTVARPAHTKRSLITGRVFQSTFKNRKGETQKTAKWYVEFNDHLGTTRRFPAYTDKDASEELLDNLEKLVPWRRATGQTNPALLEWVKGLDERIIEYLLGIGLLPSSDVALIRPRKLTEHLDDFAKHLEDKGDCPKHISQVMGRARRLLLQDCRFKLLADINANKVHGQLKAMQQDTTEQRGISAQTRNFYLQAVKQFCRWCVEEDPPRAVSNPLATLKHLNVETDRRHDRRALTLDELLRLLAAANNGPVRCGMSGPDRALLYRLAVETGLRAGELRSLTRASFRFDGKTASVTVEAKHSKRRREDTLPLRPALAAELRSFLATKMPGVEVFKMPLHGHSVAMFRGDLQDAGIVYCDDAGHFADFHALRHTFISNLARAGVHPKVAQTLARHSSIELTMQRYTHTVLEDQSQALAGLPDLSAASSQPMQATGTDDAQPAGIVLSDCLASNTSFSSPSLEIGRQNADNDANVNLPETAAFPVNSGSASVSEPHKRAVYGTAAFLDRATSA